MARLKRVDSPTWSGRSCSLPTRASKGGDVKYGSVDIDLEAYSCEPRTFLRLTIENQAYPVIASVANSFRRAVREVSTDPTAKNILDSPPERLTSLEVVRLFSIVEDKVSSWGEKSQYSMALQALQMFKDMPLSLGDGTRTDQSGFATRFKVRRRSAKADAASRPLRRLQPNAARAQEAPADPPPLIDSIEFHSLPERNASAYSAAVNRKEELAKLCLETFDRHEALVARIAAAKAAGLPMLSNKCHGLRRNGYVEGRFLLTLPEEDQLRIILYVMERDRAFEKTIKRGTSLPLSGLSLLDPYLPTHGKTTWAMRRELLLSDYYLPAPVIGACLAAIQNDKMVNPDVVCKLTRGDVEKTKRGYRFVGVKSKTDQVQGREVAVPDPSEPQRLHLTSVAAVRALDLLLRHAENIERIHRLTFVPLTTSLQAQFRTGKRIAFHQKTPARLLRLFCRLHNLEPFNSRYLRHLGLQTYVLSPEGNIYGAQALAGHGDPNTTSIYIYTNVTRHLHLANIRRFMDMLAASIIWKTNRKNLLAKSGLDKRGFNLQLLFPLEWDSDSEKSAVDEWIDSKFSAKLPIGLDELEQCAIQFNYYVANLQRLAQRNAYRFTAVHVPRILTCYALRNVILSSPFASAYRKLERLHQ